MRGANLKCVDGPDTWAHPDSSQSRPVPGIDAGVLSPPSTAAFSLARKNFPVNEQILINVTPQETRVAIMELGAVQELHVERISNRGLVGNIYLGRVGRVLPGMQSAFIEIGLARAAFLHVADIWAANKNVEQKPI